MATGRNLKPDTRRPSSSYCSTATIVVFVALCLIGLWMMTSSSGVPVDMSSSDTDTEVKNQVSETTSKSFEDSSGDVPDEAGSSDAGTKNKESSAETESESVEDQSTAEKTAESTVEKTQEENPSDKGNTNKKDELEETSKSQSYSDENGKTESGEMIKEGTPKSDDSQEGGEEKSREQKSQETTYADDEKNGKQTSDGTQNSDEDKNSEQDSSETKENKQQKTDENNTSESENKLTDDSLQDGKDQSQVEEKVEQEQSKESEGNTDQNLKEVFPDGAQSELLNETNTQNGAFSTQATESKNQKEMQKAGSTKAQSEEYSWELCNVISSADYIPCLDNLNAIKKLKTTKHYEHRERHCPDQAPTCLVPVPEGYKQPIKWPNSRDKIWFHNVPHTQLATVKGHQNWVKVSGEYLTFPGGGTQFKNGALHYIDIIQESFSELVWGNRSRVVLDVGCGVASFGGFLFERDVLTMSFAPKDEHEAQVQFALERGIPAISAVMGTKRLPFPSMVFDVIHCARCRVPWHIEGGKLLLELNRLLRPGGFFVWSATPVYQNLEEDVKIWQAMSSLTKSICWEMVNKTKDELNQVGLAIYRKPFGNTCYENRNENNPPLCEDSDDPNAAWNVIMQSCMHKLPEDPNVRGTEWPEKWPQRLTTAPYWLNNSQIGVYGMPAPKDFQADYQHWKHVVSNSYLNGMGIDWSNVRNVMDMRAVYGGFAAALRDLKVWVMNVVSIDAPDTLPVIFERGLFGIYHNWCESFNTYPRTYDLLHADHLFSRLKKRCNLMPVIVEVDRMLRPEGKLLVRDDNETIKEIENIVKSLNWEVRMTFSKEKEGLLCVMKTMWRPT